MTVSPQKHTTRREVFEGNPIQVFPERTNLPSELLPFYDFWTDACDGGVPVHRTSMDPLNLPPQILPWLFIINVKRDPLDYQYRLIGTGLTEMLARDLTGKRMSDVYYPPGHNEFLRHRLKMVAEQDLAVLASFDAGWVSKRYIKLTSLMLPGTTDGTTTDLIYGVTIRHT